MKIYNKVNNCIYGALMVAPLVAVLSSCAYSIFNENATETQVAEYNTYETNYIDYGNAPKNDIINGNVYKINLNDTYQTELIQKLYVECAFVYANSQWYYYTQDNLYCTVLQYKTSYSRVVFSVMQELPTANRSLGTFHNGSLVAESLFIVPNESTDRSFLVSSGNFIKESDITTFNLKGVTGFSAVNTYYYAIDKVQEECIFNWAKNNDIYNVFQPFTTYLGLDNEFYPMLLSYWTTISLIWFGYEVITFMVTFARNCINKFEDKAGGF